MQPTLRNYSPADFETLYAIDQVCYPRGIAYSRRTLRWFISRAGTDCLVAVHGTEGGGRIIGFIIGTGNTFEGHIITLDVLADYRRAGVGTALLNELETRLGDRGVRVIHLEAAVTNAPAVAFWERQAYQRVRILRGYYLGRIDAYLMRKELTNPVGWNELG